jgi:hypothetical protein
MSTWMLTPKVFLKAARKAVIAKGVLKYFRLVYHPAHSRLMHHKVRVYSTIGGFDPFDVFLNDHAQVECFGR